MDWASANSPWKVAWKYSERSQRTFSWRRNVLRLGPTKTSTMLVVRSLWHVRVFSEHRSKGGSCNVRSQRFEIGYSELIGNGRLRARF